MRKIILSIFVLTTIISCSTNSVSKEVSGNVDVHQIGLNYDSSANIDAILATNKDIENVDTNSYKSKYADSAVFYDNGRPTSLTENLSQMKNLITKKVQAKVSKLNAIWGSKFNFKDGTTGEFVYQHITITFTQGTKSVDVTFFQADQFKDGKIVKEWNFYDPTSLISLMQ